MEENVFIKLEHISKTFPGVKALDNISLTIKHGEVHALVGENGAGKSTLIKVLAGNYKPDEGGRIMIDGETFDSLTPRLSLHKGIVVIYQDFSLFPTARASPPPRRRQGGCQCSAWHLLCSIIQDD